MIVIAQHLKYKRPPRVNAADMVREAGGDYPTAVEAVRKLFREGEDERVFQERWASPQNQPRMDCHRVV